MNVHARLPVSRDGLTRSGGEGAGRHVGPILLVPFPVVDSVGAGVALTAIQSRLHINVPHRVRKVYAAASAVTGASTFDVYDDAGTPASILSAPATTGAADAQVAGALAATVDKKQRAAGMYTLRATTAASTGALTNLQAYMEIELLN